MRANIRFKEGSLFSNRSRSEMVRFVTADPRSWCLRSSLKEVGESDRWGPPVQIPRVIHNGNALHYIGMTLASLINPSSANHDLVLGYFTRKERFTPRIFLRLFPKILNSSASLKLKTEPVQLIDIEPKLKNSSKNGFTIASVAISHKTSADVVLLYGALKRFPAGVKSHVPFYHIAFRISMINGPPTHWTPAISIGQLTMQPTVNKKIYRDVWVGRAWTTDWAYLVYAQLETSNTDLVVASYKIGFNLSNSSGEPAEWSQQHRFPCGFSRKTRSFSISGIDIDDDRKSDIIIYVQVIAHLRSSFGKLIGVPYSAFIRVGKDLDDTGRVTKGWTRFKRLPANQKGMTAIDTTSDVKDSNPPVLIALAKSTFKHTLLVRLGKMFSPPNSRAQVDKNHSETPWTKDARDITEVTAFAAVSTKWWIVGHKKMNLILNGTYLPWKEKRKLHFELPLCTSTEPCLRRRYKTRQKTQCSALVFMSFVTKAQGVI